MTKVERYRTAFIGDLHTIGPKGPESQVTKDHAGLISEARESIQIVEETLSPFMNQLMTTAFESVLKFNPEAQIEIITGPQTDRESVDFLKKLGAKVSKLKVAPIDHFTMIDGKHIRLETRHAHGDNITDQVIFLNYNFMSQYKTTFQSLKNLATPL